MGMRINTNVEALNAQRNLSVTAFNLAKSIEKLSSGLRINRAGDDAAGLSISEKLRAQVKGLNQAIRNAQDGISLIQTAEGALNEVHSILQRMRELAVQAANDTLSADDRAAVASEVSALRDEIDRIATTTQFNGKVLLDGTYASSGISLQIGANSGQTVSVTIADMQSTAIGAVSSGPSDLDAAVTAFVGSPDATTAADLMNSVDQAISDVSSTRSSLGAYQNRLEHTIANLGVAAENLTASESRIRDVDMAAETVSFTKNSILQQAGVAILAQANQSPQSVLALLR
jgi:flagellin